MEKAIIAAKTLKLKYVVTNVFSLQPDFKAQKSPVQEVIKEAGHGPSVNILTKVSVKATL